MIAFLVFYIILIIIFVAWILYFSIGTVARKNKKLNLYKTDFLFYKFENLQNKYNFLNQKGIIDEENKGKIEDLLNHIEKYSLKEVNSYYKELENIKVINLFFKLGSIDKTFSTLYEKQFEFKDIFLKTSFIINEIGLENEIRVGLLFYLKNLFGEMKSNFKSIPYYNGTLNAKKNAKNTLVTKANKIETYIENLEKMTYITDIDFENYSKNLKNVSSLIFQIKKEYLFLDELNDFLEKEIEKRILNAKDLIEKNGSIISLKKEKLLNKASILLEQIEKIKNGEILIKNKKTDETLMGLIEDTVMLEKEVNFILDSYAFIKSNEKIIEDSLNVIIHQKRLISNNIAKYALVKEMINLDDLDKENDVYKDEYVKYVKLRQTTFSSNSPDDIFKKMNKLIQVMKKSFKIAIEKNEKINNLINDTNEANKIIYTINLNLLKIESYLKIFPKNEKIIYENKMLALQEKASELIKIIAKQKKVFNSKEIKEIYKLKEQVTDFYNEVQVVSFKFHILKRLIILFNKYNNNSEINKMVRLVEKNYLDFDPTEALRISFKILESNEIYE